MFSTVRKPNEKSSCEHCETVNQSSFCVLSKLELSLISEKKTIVTYKKGQMIFYEGSHPLGLFCIMRGKVKIHKLGLEAKDQILRFAKDSELIGYRALLSNETYHASATALEDSTICFFPKEVYQQQLTKNPLFSLQLIKLLTEDLRQSEQRTINLVQKQVKERIAETIIMLEDNFGFESDDATLNVVLTRESIGNIAGTTTETTIRVLSALQKENILKLVGKKIKIINHSELLRIANINN